MNSLRRLVDGIAWRIKPLFENMLIVAVNRDGVFIYPLLLILRCVTRKQQGRLIKLRVDWLDSTRLGNQTEIRSAQVGKSFGPILRGEQHVAKVNIPSIVLFEFDDAIVCPTSSAVWVKDTLLIERVSGTSEKRCKYAGGFLFAHGRRSAVIRQAPLVELDGGFFLGGNGAFNYYHWLIEILPKLEHFNEPGAPILVFEDALLVPSFSEALLRVGGKRATIALKKDFLYRVKKLYHLTAPVSCPWNLKSDAKFFVEDFVTRTESLDYLISRLRDGYKSENVQGRRRIFLARRATRRNYNQDEIFKLLTEFGFEMVYMEELTLRDQGRIVFNAEMIVGPTGAAWTNLIFASSGTKCLCWMDESASGFSAFSNIAHHVGAELNYITYPTAATTMDQLYQAGYYVDPLVVRERLDRMIGMPGTGTGEVSESHHLTQMPKV